MRCKRNWGGRKKNQKREVSAIWRKAFFFFLLMWLMKLQSSLFKKEGDGVKAFDGTFRSFRKCLLTEGFQGFCAELTGISPSAGWGCS